MFLTTSPNILSAKTRKYVAFQQIEAILLVHEWTQSITCLHHSHYAGCRIEVVALLDQGIEAPAPQVVDVVAVEVVIIVVVIVIVVVVVAVDDVDDVHDRADGDGGERHELEGGCRGRRRRCLRGTVCNTISITAQLLCQRGYILPTRWGPPYDLPHCLAPFVLPNFASMGNTHRGHLPRIQVIPTVGTFPESRWVQ